MLIGTGPFELLSRLANLDDTKKHYIHCFNILDYLVPTKEENITARAYRSELRRVFKLLKRVDTTIPSTQLEQLHKLDYLDLDDIDLEINAWIQQVFDNKNNYDAVYRFLSGDLTKSNIELVPLTNTSPEIILYKGNKIAPLRFYYQKKRLLDRDTIPDFEQFRGLVSEELAIHGNEGLASMELNEEARAGLKNSSALVILASDLVSLGIFSLMTSVLEEIKALPPKVVLVIPGELSDFADYTEEEIFDLLGLGGSISKMIDKLSHSMDYIISPDQDNGLRELLLETGYQIEDDQLEDPVPTKNTQFIEFLQSLDKK